MNVLHRPVSKSGSVVRRLCEAIDVDPGQREDPMRKLIVSEFLSLDGVMQAPGGKDEDRDGGFEHGGWTLPYWSDEIRARFGALIKKVAAFLLGPRTYLPPAAPFEPMPAGDVFG